MGRPALENLLMTQLGLTYGAARKLVLEGRTSLGMSKFSEWTDELADECRKLHSAKGDTSASSSSVKAAATSTVAAVAKVTTTTAPPAPASPVKKWTPPAKHVGETVKAESPQLKSVVKATSPVPIASAISKMEEKEANDEAVIQTPEEATAAPIPEEITNRETSAVEEANEDKNGTSAESNETLTEEQKPSTANGETKPAETTLDVGEDKSTTEKEDTTVAVEEKTIESTGDSNGKPPVEASKADDTVVVEEQKDTVEEEVIEEEEVTEEEVLEDEMFEEEVVEEDYEDEVIEEEVTEVEVMDEEIIEEVIVEETKQMEKITEEEEEAVVEQESSTLVDDKATDSPTASEPAKEAQKEQDVEIKETTEVVDEGEVEASMTSSDQVGVAVVEKSVVVTEDDGTAIDTGASADPSAPSTMDEQIKEPATSTEELKQEVNDEHDDKKEVVEIEVQREVIEGQEEIKEEEVKDEKIIPPSIAEVDNTTPQREAVAPSQDTQALKACDVNEKTENEPTASQANGDVAKESVDAAVLDSSIKEVENSASVEASAKPEEVAMEESAPTQESNVQPEGKEPAETIKETPLTVKADPVAASMTMNQQEPEAQPKVTSETTTKIVEKIVNVNGKLVRQKVRQRVRTTNTVSVAAAPPSSTPAFDIKEKMPATTTSIVEEVVNVNGKKVRRKIKKVRRKRDPYRVISSETNVQVS